MNTIYRFLDSNNNIIYIGKSIHINERIRNHRHLVQECYDNTSKIQYTTFDTQNDMDLAEIYLISKIKPKYNKIYKDNNVTIIIDELDYIDWYDYDNTVQDDTFKYNRFNDEKGYLFRPTANIISTFKINNKLISMGLSHVNIGKLLILAINTDNDNMISHYYNKKYHPAEISHISEMINLCERRCIKFIKDMIDIGVIAETCSNTKHHVEIQYYLNPLYFLSSKYLSPSLYMLFQKQINQVLPDWVIDRFMNFTDMIE